MVNSVVSVQQTAIKTKGEPNQEHSGIDQTNESDSAVELLVSLRNMDKKTPTIAEPMKQKASQQPSTPNQVILYNYILVPCVPAFTLPRLLV